MLDLVPSKLSMTQYAVKQAGDHSNVVASGHEILRHTAPDPTLTTIVPSSTPHNSIRSCFK